MSNLRDIKAMPTYRLLEGLQDVVKACWDAADQEALAKNDDIVDRMFSNDGYVHPNADPAAPLTNALAAGFDLLGAYHAAEMFADKCSSLFQVRGLTNAVKADWCRSLSWHYTYVLRERSRMFLSTIQRYVADDRLAEWRSEISECARIFKRDTDKHLTARGKHVHNFSVDDPWAEQIKLIELLAQGPEQREPWQTVLKWRQRKVRREIKERARSDVRAMMQYTDQLIAASEPVWKAIYSVMAEDYRKHEQALKSA